MAGEFGEDLCERLACVLSRGHGHQFRVRMAQQQPDEFLAGITGRAHNGDLLRFHIRIVGQWSNGAAGICNSLFQRPIASKSKSPADQWPAGL
jgi:hypothetical protein